MLMEFKSSSILMTFLKVTSRTRFVITGAEYPVSFVKQMNASFFDGLSAGSEQSFKLAKQSSHTPEIINVYLKINIFFSQNFSRLYIYSKLNILFYDVMET